MKILTDRAGIFPDFDLKRLAPEKGILFFDIETTGLKKETTQVYLIGCAWLEKDEWMIRQYLAESALDEQEVMEAFCSFASGFQTLVHFNGDGFDIPYLAYKAEYYDLDFDFCSLESIDIYRLAKPLKKLLGLDSLSQKSIERFLKIHREDLYGGGALIRVFYDYERSGSPEAEKLLLLHNYDDVRGMLKIISILNYLPILEGGFSFQNMEILQETAVFDYRLDNPVPVGFDRALERERIQVFAEQDLLQINVRIFRGKAKLPLPDVENYYYLPEEDRVIHKDVAQFVDRSRRKKATKKNCFLWKEGLFLPQRHKLFEPAFQIEEEKKKCFFELSPSIVEDHRLLTEYALDILHA